jgi:hypothetical protein
MASYRDSFTFSLVKIIRPKSNSNTKYIETVILTGKLNEVRREKWKYLQVNLLKHRKIAVMTSD